MTNELLLIGTLIVLYGAVLLWFYLFGTGGLMAFTVFATIAANIEVLILIDAYGMEMTLGNILFATTFLVTDILSEIAGKKAAQRAVWAGIAANVLFILVSQSWLAYIPSVNDWAMPSMKAIFSNTPRMMLSSLAVYAVAQVFDVWLYHKWWEITEKKTGDHRAFLWLRNNGSTLVSQMVNTVLFTALAFWGTYDIPTLISVALSSYVIFIFTSLLDTPVVYAARRLHDKKAGHTADADVA
ncbi:MAG TPA: queuosine precursor transporter [Candidatus Agathobaculum merdipullorum]|nr:queuosine precursor transporter [Candidatus Agathobaculum merdipullorum]